MTIVEDDDELDEDTTTLVTRVRQTEVPISRALSHGDRLIGLVELTPHSVDARVKYRVKGGGEKVRTEQVLEIVALVEVPPGSQFDQLATQIRETAAAAAGQHSLFDDVGAAPGPTVIADADGTVLTAAEVAAAQGIDVEDTSETSLVAEADAWLDEHNVDPYVAAQMVAAVGIADQHALEALDAWEQYAEQRDEVYEALDARKEELARPPRPAPGDDPMLHGLPIEQARERLGRIGEPGPLRLMLAEENATKTPRKRLTDAIHQRLREVLDDAGEDES